MNVKSFHLSIIKKLFYLEKKQGITTDCNYNLTASYAMKVWPKKEQSSKKTKLCYEGKQLYVGKKKSWHDVRGQNLLETCNPTDCNLFT